MVARRSLKACDRCWARAVQRYVDARLPGAEKRLPAPALSSFQSFCKLWQLRFDLSTTRARSDLQNLTPSERRQLFLRFVSQCRSWEASLRLSTSPVQALARPAPQARGSRLRELEARLARTRGFYDQLARDVSSQLEGLRLPWSVREAFHKLDLPAGAPIDEVRRSYRQLAVQHHPDRSGDADTMATLSRAYHFILEYYRTLAGD